LLAQGAAGNVTAETPRAFDEVAFKKIVAAISLKPFRWAEPSRPTPFSADHRTRRTVRGPQVIRLSMGHRSA